MSESQAAEAPVASLPVAEAGSVHPLPAAFIRLAASNLAAQFSEQIALAAAPIVAVIALGASAGQTGLLQAAQTLPFLILSLPAGVLVDRMKRRGLMFGAELLRALSLLAILVAVMADELSLGLLAALGCLGAVGTVVYNVAAPSILPGLVPRESLAAANRWLELARSVAFTAGPAIGSALIGWSGVSSGYALALGLSLFAAGMLLRLDEPIRPSVARRNIREELSEGTGFVMGHVLLRPVLFTAVVFNLSWFMLQAVFVVYAIRIVGITAAGVGLILATYGIGMVAGALATSAIERRVRWGVLTLIGPGCGAVGAAVVCLTIVVPSGLLLGLAFFLFGAGPIIWTISTTTLRQAVTPQVLLGRVSAFVMTATFGARPLGAGLGALIAFQAGVELCLLVMLAGFVLQLVIVSTSPLRQLQNLPGPAQ